LRRNALSYHIFVINVFGVGQLSNFITGALSDILKRALKHSTPFPNTSLESPCTIHFNPRQLASPVHCLAKDEIVGFAAGTLKERSLHDTASQKMSAFLVGSVSCRLSWLMKSVICLRRCLDIAPLIRQTLPLTLPLHFENGGTYLYVILGQLSLVTCAVASTHLPTYLLAYILTEYKDEGVSCS